MTTLDVVQIVISHLFSMPISGQRFSDLNKIRGIEKKEQQANTKI